MGLTFDEAIKALERDGLFWDDMSEAFVTDIIDKLQQEYAPTVKMTKKQYHSFKLWKYHTAGWNMTNCAEWAQDEHILASEAMRAWLHPETIEPIEE
ncbi:hypothetical protein RND61_15595 [Streptomyces sp. TRM76323]|uniref:Uncharacterized protein n=1 Tax=Streptomyces tamarix TaxID=3078565 RepID=A0ABU3QL14_9ACTN|nr:hypothetical protein [Streptomyces tamarix]MDT9683472.1 hypothetical protein [Streptomyces tamarix]